MKFEQPLRQGKFLKRYKRYFADIEFEGEVITALCPNTGSMKGCKEPGSPCRFSSNDDPKRKLKHTLEMVKTPTSWIGVNTALPNKLVQELFQTDPLKHWKKYDNFQGEVKINDKSRMDLVLWKKKDHPDIKKWNHKNLAPPLHIIEIKNVTMGEDGVASFPDAVTTRGQKHLEELTALAQKGFSCEMVYVVQREDCDVFTSADAIDPGYGEKLRKAKKSGVKITALHCRLDKKSVTLTSDTLKVKL